MVVASEKWSTKALQANTKGTAAPALAASESLVVAAEQATETPTKGTESSLVAQTLAKSANKRRQPREKKPVDSAVAKVIYDNFRSLSAAQVDTTVVEGLTLHQRLISDREFESKRPGSYSFAANYYKGLRTMYVGDTDLVKMLTVACGHVSEEGGIPRQMMPQAFRSHGILGLSVFLADVRPFSCSVFLFCGGVSSLRSLG